MAESFTSKQKEIVARKLGYDGPMQGFDDYVSSSPALGMKYAMLSDKFATRMAKGGVVKKAPVRKFVVGGDVAAATGDAAATTTPKKLTDDEVKKYLQDNPGLSDKQIAAKMNEFNVPVDQMARATGANPNDVQARYDTATSGAPTSLSGKPIAPSAATFTAAQTTAPEAVKATGAGKVETATLTKAEAPKDIAAPKTIKSTDVKAASAADDVEAEMAKLKAEQGAVSEEAQVTAETQDPTTTAIADVEAAQGEAAQVEGAPTRTVQEGEMITGSAVDMDKVEEALAKTTAQEGVVTEEMTLQGQLNKLTKDFDAGNPPPWAAASMRAATAQLAARGLGASSMAGQAIIQATLEAATPIAAADAKVFETMGLQNLSNRQQTAMLIGQQRATFLGQKFDQDFQTKVLNAAKISDIANKNFDAQTTIALENARLVNSMNIANLSANNAVVLSKMAQMSSLETQNLNNRQQAAVENAKAFLSMDIRNLELRQQTALFKAQEISDALVSDAGLENAARITNANNALEAAKISETLTQAANQFNASERNKVSLFNANAANELAKFNASEKNNRAEFNAKMKAEINISNAKIQAEISTANTRETNAANAVNAKNATDLSASAYAQQSQTYRDTLEMSWKTGEQEKDRITNIAVATITKNASVAAASIKADADSSAAWGSLALKAVENWDKVEKGAKAIWALI
jgi:hypothetical protein